MRTLAKHYVVLFVGAVLGMILCEYGAMTSFRTFSPLAMLVSLQYFWVNAVILIPLWAGACLTVSFIPRDVLSFYGRKGFVFKVLGMATLGALIGPLLRGL